MRKHFPVGNADAPTDFFCLCTLSLQLCFKFENNLNRESESAKNNGRLFLEPKLTSERPAKLKADTLQSNPSQRPCGLAPDFWACCLILSFTSFSSLSTFSLSLRNSSCSLFRSASLSKLMSLACLKTRSQVPN